MKLSHIAWYRTAPSGTHFLTNVYVSNANAEEGELIAIEAKGNKADTITITVIVAFRLWLNIDLLLSCGIYYSAKRKYK
jgi:hypothetical protein